MLRWRYLHHMTRGAQRTEATGRGRVRDGVNVLASVETVVGYAVRWTGPDRWEGPGGEPRTSALEPHNRTVKVSVAKEAGTDDGRRRD